MIHWTCQIKSVLSPQSVSDVGDTSGPLEEISFRKSRCGDLDSISKQLQKPGVFQIQAILQLYPSTYIPLFCKLAKQIQDSALQAQSDVSFPSLLKESCEELAQLKPLEIAPKLAHILDLIRVIWVNSSYYNSCDSITSLLC
ncbi:hypothetical protein cypCar_00000642, partial [Cyprinus carpio]